MNIDRPELAQLLRRIDRSFDQTSLADVITVARRSLARAVICWRRTHERPEN